MLKSGYEFAKKKHEGQMRKNGKEYITHPERTKEILKEIGIVDEDYLLAALFHDLLEDTNTSDKEILKYSNERVLKVVKDLTKEEDYIMEEYMENIKKDEMSTLVKLADRLSNLEDLESTNDEEFIYRYIDDTEKWFLDLAKGTILEEQVYNKYNKLRDKYGESRNKYGK